MKKIKWIVMSEILKKCNIILCMKIEIVLWIYENELKDYFWYII